MKTLGICIPTYKRPDFLRHCVHSAIVSAEGRSIGIYIADDSISNTNDQVIAELQVEYPFVTVHRNPVNLGIDDNIQQAVSLCDCKYAWIIGEDDTFLPGAIARMHDRLETLDNPFIFSNYLFVGNDPSSPLGKAQLNVSEGPMAADHFLANHLWAVGFIGSCIVRCDAWSRTDPAPYAGTYYTHVGRIAELISGAGGAYISAECGVANRVEGAGAETFTWWGDSYGVFFGFLTMCKAAEQRCPISAQALQRARETFESRFLTIKLAVRLRAELSYNYGQYCKYLSNYSSLSALKKLALRIVSVTPPILFQPIILIHRAIRRVI